MRRLFPKQMRPATMAMLLTLLGGLSAPAYMATVAITFAVSPNATAAPASSPAAAPAGSSTVGVVDLGSTPPQLTQAVAPNIALTFDDSGSMGSTGLPDTVDNADGGGTGYTTKEYYSSSYNYVYFDPTKTYSPPSNPDGTSFPNSSYTNAWRDGICANTTGSGCNDTVNLATSFTSKATGFPSDLFASNCPNSANAYSAGVWRSKGCKSVGIPPTVTTAVGGFWYTYNGSGSVTDGSNYTLHQVSDTSDPTALAALQQNFANWYSYYRTRNLMARTSLSQAFANVTAGSIQIVWQNMNVNPLATGTSISLFSGTQRTNFFNFLYSSPNKGSTPTLDSTIRVGNYFSQTPTLNNKDPYWNGKSGNDAKDLTCRKNFHILVTDGYWTQDAPGGAPSSSSYPISNITLPDNVNYSSSATATSVYWNRNSGSAISPTLSDLAFYYWATDLQPTIANNLSPYWSGTGYPNPATAPASDYFNPSNDPATWQHLDMYAVGLGVNGTLTQNSTTLSSLVAGSTAWPAVNDSSNGGDGTGIDDTWHAALNSRGLFFSATSPSLLASQLASILSNISAESAPTTSATLNTSVLTAGAQGYNTGFNLSNWSGTFTASILNTNGMATGGAWSANTALDARTAASRQILTGVLNSGGTAVTGAPFEWTSLGTSETTLLNSTPASTGTGDTGQARLAWLRGDRTSETASIMRTRSTLLGPIINAQPLYVSYPSSGYSDNWPTNSPEALATNATPANGYDQFVQTYNPRRPMVYVGANDGMLHAFDATQNADGTSTSTSGNELWAYVPRAAYSDLGALTLRKNFKPITSVDATPITRDVFFPNAAGTNGSWHTILVGGLRLGGRGVYALDITDPTNVAESTAGSSVLWEFSSNMGKVASSSAAAPALPGTNPGGNPADLGYTYGQPNIGRLANGRWVVLVPAGYFPDCKASDAPPGCVAQSPYNTFSSLFVLDAQTGALINELKTPSTVTSYGLSSPVLGDYNNDQIDDVAFAGDLVGNLWHYDLSNPDPSKWTVALAYQPTTPYAQPITVMPRLFPDPATGKFIVVFGTGKYLGAYDNIAGNQAQQAVYGIRDLGTTVVGTTNLQAQTLSDAAGSGGQTLRGDTNNLVSASQSGWYFNLIDTGERVVVTPTALFDTNRVIIVTLIPQSDDPCAAANTGAVMVVNAATGGADGGLSSLGSGWSTGGGAVSYQPVGVLVKNPPTTGTLPVATVVGGGVLKIPGLDSSLSIDDAIWRRRSWRELNQ